MRKVLIKKWIEGIREYNSNSIRGWNYQEGTNCFEKDYSTEGVFHTWGSNYTEFEGGAGNFTVGIVELNDGTVIEVLPVNIKFI